MLFVIMYNIKIIILYLLLEILMKLKKKYILFLVNF